MRKSLDVPGSNPNDKSTFVRLEIIMSVLLNGSKAKIKVEIVRVRFRTFWTS